MAYSELSDIIAVHYTKKANIAFALAKAYAKKGHNSVEIL